MVDSLSSEPACARGNGKSEPITSYVHSLPIESEHLRSRRSRSTQIVESSGQFSSPNRLAIPPSFSRRRRRRLRRSYIVDLLHWLRQWLQCSPLYRTLSISIAALVVIQIIFKPFSTRKIDHMLTFRVMAKHFNDQHLALEKLGVSLPRTQVTYANEINTRASLREMLVQREQRGAQLQMLEQTAAKCARQTSYECKVPRVLFVPNVFSWMGVRPSQAANHNFTSVIYEDFEMRQVVEDVSNLLQPQGDSLTGVYDQLHKNRHNQVVDLFALCVIYLYGGAFVGSGAASNVFVQNILFDEIERLEQAQSTPLVFAVENSLNLPAAKSGIRLLMAPPRHALLGCLLFEVKMSDVESGVLHQLIANSKPRVATQSSWLPLQAGASSSSWLHFALPYTPNALTACSRNPAVIQEIADLSDHLMKQKTGWSMYTRLNDGTEEGPRIQKSYHIDISIGEDALVHPTKHAKKTVQSILRDRGAEPGWLCNRCLSYAFRGTFEKCSLVCPDGYKHLICNSADDPEENIEIIVDINVKASTDSTSKLPTAAIPRILHQTWFENISADRYPNLARLRNSWRNSGWDLRFYTDETARQYIKDNYPYRFVEAFDALIHGAYKADLFRYLVLLKEGGIYADIDVKLETSLDSFATFSSMTFFAARDIPCEYAGQAFCFWNGFIGAAPGSPILVRAVERLVNLIRKRADIYDMERETCNEAGGSMDVWKVRAQPLLFLSGPCALGVAFNEALNRPPLQTLPTGWIGIGKIDSTSGHIDHGDALILVSDKYDLGEFRISDPVRNFIIASTDIRGVEKVPREAIHSTSTETKRRAIRLQPLPHYSNSKRGVSLWGSANVYKDNLVVNEKIKFRVRYMNGV